LRTRGNTRRGISRISAEYANKLETARASMDLKIGPSCVARGRAFSGIGLAA